ncbi:MAG: immunoglobulin-like domain-containing protein, partial [Clostridium sp.]
VQEKTGVEVVLTLPVMPEGLISVDMDSFDAYLSEGVDIKMVNVMTMCYGTSSIRPGETYATASVRAIENLKNQIQAQYKKYGRTLSDQEAYLKCGTTVSIGFEGSAHPYWGTDYSRVVVDDAKVKGLGMTAFWSMNRDALLDKGGQVKNQYEHTAIFKEFGKTTPDPDPDGNEAPVLSGIENKTISAGSYFNSMYMVQASDKEDGDLTDNVVVTGSVNNQVAGDYQLTYSVADSKGKKTTKTRTIKVVKGAVIEGEQWDPTKVYTGGEIVVYNGAKYKAKWWTQGDQPDKGGSGNAYPWELVEGGGSAPKPDIVDLAEVANKYNLKKGDSAWDMKYDLNVDKIVDIYDLVIVATQL